MGPVVFIRVLKSERGSGKERVRKTQLTAEVTLVAMYKYCLSICKLNSKGMNYIALSTNNVTNSVSQLLFR